MDKAREILAKYEDVFQKFPGRGKSNLRFGRSLVKISSIAGQYYCEKNLELQNQYPLPPSERMQHRMV